MHFEYILITTTRKIPQHAMLNFKTLLEKVKKCFFVFRNNALVVSMRLATNVIT